MKIINNSKESRTLINIIGLPTLLFVFYVGGILFNLFVYLVIILAIKEFNDLMKHKNYSLNSIILYCVLIFIAIYQYCNMEYLMNSMTNSLFLSIIFLVGSIIISICEIFRFKENPVENIAISIFALFWFVVLFSNLVYISELSFTFTLCMFLSVWSCDTAAFFFGLKFGDKKILPSISPNKTWIGSIAGLISSILFVQLLYQINPFHPFNGFYYYGITKVECLIMGIIFGGISQLGDFFESMIKREIGVKDSGTILRGHGGVLDRFDSLFFVVPFFYIFLIWCGLYG